MIIALEGPDLGGKTTLALELQRRFEAAHGPGTAPIWHEGPPPEGGDLVAHYEAPLVLNRERLVKTNHLTILDRWETGELVYGPLLRGGSRLTTGQAYHVDLLLHALGALRVLVQPDLSALYERYDARGDDLVKREWLSELHAFYDEYHRRHRWGVTVGYPGSGAVTYLLDAVRQVGAGARFLGDFPGYVGWPRPEVLLVGDRRNNYPAVPGDGSGAWGRGAFTPTGGYASSHWLLDALERLDELPAVGLANAIEPDQDLAKLWTALGCPPVVILGNAALSAVDALEIPHEHVCHPQYAKRFKNKEPEAYTLALREAIDRARSPETED